MSGAIGYDEQWKRDIGYGVPAYCDEPGCSEKIDRGLSYVCGNEPYGGEHGCGLFFCWNHLYGHHAICGRCLVDMPSYEAKPDHPDWLHHKATDPSWEEWRTQESARGKITS